MRGGRVARALLVVALSLSAMTVVRVAFADLVTVESDSMTPTANAGEVVVVEKWDRTPERGSLVVFHGVGGEPTIKRVVGVAGDVVAIRDALLFVNGEQVDEPYVDQAASDAHFFGPLEVPDDTVLVLGDARHVSIDSRDYGPVPVSSIIGSVHMAVWPMTWLSDDREVAGGTRQLQEPDHPGH